MGRSVSTRRDTNYDIQQLGIAIDTIEKGDPNIRWTIGRELLSMNTENSGLTIDQIERLERVIAPRYRLHFPTLLKNGVGAEQLAFDLGVLQE